MVCANRLNEGTRKVSRDSYARFLMAMKARNNRNDNGRALAVHFVINLVCTLPQFLLWLGAGTLTER